MRLLLSLFVEEEEKSKLYAFVIIFVVVVEEVKPGRKRVFCLLFNLFLVYIRCSLDWYMSCMRMSNIYL